MTGLRQNKNPEHFPDGFGLPGQTNHRSETGFRFPENADGIRTGNREVAMPPESGSRGQKIPVVMGNMKDHGLAGMHAVEDAFIIEGTFPCDGILENGKSGLSPLQTVEIILLRPPGLISAAGEHGMERHGPGKKESAVPVFVPFENRCFKLSQSERVPF